MKHTSPPITPITLGTVQLGLPYGIANRNGMPSDEEALEILEAAWMAGVRTFDTARVYGVAEARIGSWTAATHHRPFIVSKVPKLENDTECADHIRKSITETLANLGVNFLDGLMLHSSTDLFRPGVQDTLIQLLAEQKIGQFGISAYDPGAVDRALEVPGLSILQIPYNLFDRRIETSGVLSRCKAANINVFARSVFLQGLFFIDPDALPQHLAEAAQPLMQLRTFAKDIGRSLTELALVMVRDTPGIASMVIGAERASQIIEIMSLSTAPPLSDDQRKAVFKIGENLPERIYHPTKWA